MFSVVPTRNGFSGPAIAISRPAVRRRPRVYPLAGLGAANPTAAAAGATAGSVVGTFAVPLIAAGPVGWVVLGVAELAAVFLHFFGGGCGNACVAAAGAEQVAEAAALNIIAVYNAGMISGQNAANALQGMIQAGQALEAQAGKGVHFTKGTAHLAEVIQSYTGSIDPSRQPSKPLDMSAAQALFIKPGTHGWYDSSLTAAITLTNQCLSMIEQAQKSTVAGALSEITSATGLPSWALLLGLVAVVFFVMD